MNTQVSATSRANAISCVTSTMVIPSEASCRTTCRTSPTSSGSSAEVASSKSITSGFIASARAMATRCFCPPDSRSGETSAFSRKPTLSRSRSARSRVSSRPLPSTVTGPSMTFRITDMWGNRLKFWNTMPTVARKAARSLSRGIR